MGKGRTIGVMVIVLLICMSGVGWGAKTIYVHPDGDDENGDGTQQNPYATIQKGIDEADDGQQGDYSKVVVMDDPTKPVDYVIAGDPGVRLDEHNYQQIIFYQDVVVEGGSWFDNDWPPRTWRALFRVENVHHVKFTGYAGATFRLTKEPGSETYNGSRAIWLAKSSNVEISGLTLEKSRGDGINIGYISKNDPGACEDIEITNVDCDDNSRNAISVISVDILTIDDCILRNTSGAVDGPCAGIKIEPETSSDLLKDIVVRHTTIRGNAGGGSSSTWPKQLGIGLGKLRGNPSEPVSITFEDILVTDGPGILVSTICDDGPEGSIVFKRVTVESTHSGADIRKSANANKADLSFENCRFKETGSGYSPIEIRPRGGIVYPGGVDFIDCEVFDDVARPAIKYDGLDWVDNLYEIHGDIYVIRNQCVGPLFDWDGATLHNVDVTVYSPACCRAFSVKDTYGNTVALFDKLGNVYLEGEKEAGRAASANDEFIFGNDLVIIDASNGNMYMDGDVNEDQGTLQNPAGDDFIIKDDSGNVVAYINESGDVFLKGWLYENSEP